MVKGILEACPSNKNRQGNIFLAREVENQWVVSKWAHLVEFHGDFLKWNPNKLAVKFFYLFKYCLLGHSKKKKKRAII